MLGLTRSTLLLPLFSLPFLIQPLVNAQSQAQGRPKVFTCPKDNGIQYTAANGIIFELKCGQGTTAKRIDNTPCNSQKECADLCAEHPGCQSADWNQAMKSCARFSEYIPTINMAGVNTWFPIEKRKEPEKTYACPEDDGAKYTTPNGVTFELKCNMGTSAKWLDGGIQVPSQKACADLCSEEPTCQSCDWRVSDGRCVRFTEWIPNIPSPGINTWFPAEERGQPQPAKEERSPPDCPKPNPALVETDGFVAAASEAQCPENDGKIFVTTNGFYYQITCNAVTSTEVEIIKRPLHDFAECMTACGEVPGCDSVSFSAGKPNWDCKFFSTGVSVESVDPNSKIGFANAIEPPTSAKPDDQFLLCATECPMADGQTFETPNGVKYHMDCCKRHGITVISSDTTLDFKTCMSACSMINGCTSVDWHQDTGICYFGKHSGEPTVLVAGWASAHSLGCGSCKKQSSGGCDCGNKSEL